MGGSMDIEQKECESNECCTHYVTLSYDLDAGFSRSNFEKAVSHEWGDRLAERKGCELIDCRTRYVTLTFNPTNNQELGFPRSNFEIAISQEWERKGSESDTMLDPMCNLELWPQPWFDIEFLDFEVKFWNSCISGMGGPIDMKIWIDKMVVALCDSWPIALTLDFQG